MAHTEPDITLEPAPVSAVAPAQSTSLGVQPTQSGWKVKRIVAVKDTRTLEEQGDRWVRIPGSGDIAQCDRCGRDHEVHVTVELEDGRTQVVGVSCAHAEGEMAVRLRSAVTASRTVEKLRAELARQQAEVDAWRDARSKAEEFPYPGYEELDPVVDADEVKKTAPYLVGMQGSKVWRVRGTNTWCTVADWQFTAGRREAERNLEGIWRGAQAERIMGRRPKWSGYERDMTAARLRKAEKKLSQLLAEEPGQGNG